MELKNTAIRVFVVLLCVHAMVNAVTAIEPSWTFSDNGREIGDIVVAPDGTSVAATTGKVILLSRNGTALAKEPFGNRLGQSQDGSRLVSVYYSTLYSFEKSSGVGGQPSLRKEAEATASRKITSFSVSQKGDRVAVATEGGIVQVFDMKNGKSLGQSEESSAVVGIAPRGGSVAGLSAGLGLKTYGSAARFSKHYDIAVSDNPAAVFFTPDGKTVIFDNGQYINAFTAGNGSQLWKTKASGTINTLVMTPAGNYFVAGTGNGNIDLFNGTGVLHWTFSTKVGALSGQEIKTVAVNNDATRIIAGTYNGRILLLDGTGRELWNYTAADHIRRVAISSDGSLSVASGERTLYVFYGSPEISRVAERVTARVTTMSMAERTPASNQSTRNVSTTVRTLVTVIPTQTSTEEPTEYSVLRTATATPLPGWIGIGAVLIVVVMSFRKKR